MGRRTMASPAERRAAAELRRRQAGEAGDRGGDEAYRQYRSGVPGLTCARRVSMPTQIRAAKESRNGKPMFHTWGLFTRYERGYPMWDTFGEYEEVTARGSGRRSLASNPDVAFLVNHRGMTMARTRNGTLLLDEQHEGGHHEAWLNPERTDVRDFISAVDDQLITEMSYAFMIPDGAGEWDEDFMTFRIMEWDINRGDVSGVNYGANPYTDIAAQTPDVLDALDRLPAGALREAGARLAQRGAPPAPARDRIEVRGVLPEVDPGASRAVRALQGRHVRTAQRLADYATRNGLTVAEAAAARLPWYEIRAGVPLPADDDGEDTPRETTDVFIYDEIGGSMGVSAKQFAKDLAEITTPVLRIRINSPGGSVFDGEAIHSAILHHPSRTVAYIDGLAASAASFIPLAADEIVTMPAGEWMIHDASMLTEGNPADHQKAVTFLDRHSDHIAGFYATRMGIPVEEARDLMRAETWMFPAEAVEAGLADRVGSRADALPEGGEQAERMAHRHDLRNWAYRYQGRSAAPIPNIGKTSGPFVPIRRRTGDLAKAFGLDDPAHDALDAVNGAEGDERAAAIAAEVAKRTSPPPDDHATPEQPRGRSIALIQAAQTVRERE